MKEKDVRRRKKVESAKEFSGRAEYQPEQEMTIEERSKIAFEAMAAMQRLDLAYRLEKERVRVKLDADSPQLILFISDIHWGSVSSDVQLLRRFMDFILQTPNVFVVFNGDLVEGRKGSHNDTTEMQSVMNVTNQFSSFKDAVLLPLLHAGRVLAIEGGHKGHDEWIREFAQVNPGLLFMNGAPLPLVQNGGYLEIEHNDGEVEVIQISHHPGSGGSQIDPVGAARKLYLDSPRKGHITTVGHTHRLGAVSTEAGGAIFVKSGAFKDLMSQLPDAHSRRDMGSRRSAPPGQSTIHFAASAEQGRMEWRRYATPSLQEAGVLLEAMTLWNLAEQQGATDELIQSSKFVAGDPQVFMRESGSRTRKAPGDPVPHFERLVWDISSKLPFTIDTFNGLRAGSKSSMNEAYKHRVLTTANDHFRSAIMLREMLDSDLASHPQRGKHLDNFIVRSLPLANAWDQPGKTLAMLASGSLMNEAWGGPIDAKEGEGLFPGVKISDRLGWHLLDNEGEVRVFLNKQPYVFRVWDKTKRSMSFLFNPFQGLRRMEDSWVGQHVRPNVTPDFTDDVILGGHGTQEGVLTQYNQALEKQQIYLAPGWLARLQNVLGKSNRTAPPSEWQSITLMPDRRMIFPTVSERETRDVREALLLFAGLELILDDAGKTGREYWLQKLRANRSPRTRKPLRG